MNDLQSLFNDRNVEFEWIPHAKPIRSAQDGADYFGIEIGQTAPTIVVRSKDAYYAVILSGDYGRIDLAALGALLGRGELKLAKPEEVRQRTGYAIGTVPLVGHGLPTVFDRQLNRYAVIYGGTGEATLTLKIAPADVERLNDVIAYVR